MNPIAWLSESNPLPLLQQKWQQDGRLDSDELQLLEENRKLNPDSRVRETCRVLLAAISGKSEAEPHVQKLLRGRNLMIFRSKVRRQAQPHQ